MISHFIRLSELQRIVREAPSCSTPVSDHMVRFVMQSLRAAGHDVSEEQVRAVAERIFEDNIPIPLTNRIYPFPLVHRTDVVQRET